MRKVTHFRNQVIELFEDRTWRPILSTGSALERLKAAAVPPQVVALLSGLFERVGIEIIETGEKVVIAHKGDHLEFTPDTGQLGLDFELRIRSYQVEELIRNAAVGYSDPNARFRLVREFLQALPTCFHSVLSHGILTNPAFRKLINSKDLLHFYLVSPDPEVEEDATYTMFFVNGTWNVAQGLAGKADRVFRMTVEQALDLLKHGFAGSKAGMVELPNLARWYMTWRKGVEVAAA